MAGVTLMYSIHPITGVLVIHRFQNPLPKYTDGAFNKYLKRGFTYEKPEQMMCECGEGFYLQQLKDLHVCKEVPVVQVVNPLKCDLCDKVSKSELGKASHLRKHTREAEEKRVKELVTVNG
ncbi:hypothetical protein LCGC14_0927000 [marine sediment metagenome]|uniref:C2H2-type domain-containing protein n=1 Tax=marine sediment metagenome TaxID=412755 RepID=A0A0F9NTS6_9ZZZZ